MSKYNLVFDIAEKLFDITYDLKDDLIDSYKEKRREKLGYSDLLRELHKKQLTVQMNRNNFSEDMMKEYTKEISDLRAQCKSIESKSQFPKFLDVLLSVIAFIISLGIGFLIFGAIVWLLSQMLQAA